MRRVHGADQRCCNSILHIALSSVKGEIITLEGLAGNGQLHPVQQAWIDEQVPQCGFCQNGRS